MPDRKITLRTTSKETRLKSRPPAAASNVAVPIPGIFRRHTDERTSGSGSLEILETLQVTEMTYIEHDGVAKEG